MPGYKNYSLSPGQADLKGAFVTNGTNAPDGLRGTGFTVTRTGAGVYKVALAYPPDYYTQFDSYHCEIHLADHKAYVTAEDADNSTAPYIEITVKKLTQNGTTGNLVATATDTTDVVITFSITVRAGAAGV